MKAWVALAVLALPASALADERYDHRGALGVLIAFGADYKAAAAIAGGGDEGARAAPELGLTFPIGDNGNELKASLRALFGGILPNCSASQRCAPVDLGLFFGFRGYFTAPGGRLKTFYDLDVVQHLVPRFSDASARTQLYVIGPRVGLGVQFETLPIAGLYFMIDGQMGFGDGLRFGAGAQLGIQLRTYIFE